MIGCLNVYVLDYVLRVRVGSITWFRVRVRVRIMIGLLLAG
jgi:hypothetical protein